MRLKQTKNILFFRKNIVLQLEAYYRYSIGKLKIYNIDDLIDFVDTHFDHYINFYHKWIFQKYSNVKCIEYTDFVTSSFVFTKQILNEINDLKFNNEKIQNVLNSEINTDKKISTIKMLYTIDEQIYYILRTHIIEKLTKTLNVVNKEIISNID